LDNGKEEGRCVGRCKKQRGQEKYTTKPDRYSPSLDNGKVEGEASGDARNRGGRRNASGDTSLDNGKEEGDLHRATINRGGRRNASGDASLDNGMEEGDASGDASNAPPFIKWEGSGFVGRRVCWLVTFIL
jgi:hypothetical protein